MASPGGLPGQGRSTLQGCAASNGALRSAATTTIKRRVARPTAMAHHIARWPGTNRLVPSDPPSDRLVISAAGRIGGRPSPEPCAQVRILLGGPPDTRPIPALTRTGPARNRARARPSARARWVSQPCWLTTMSGRNARSSGGTTAQRARRQQALPPAMLAPWHASPAHTFRAAARVAPATSADASCMPANTARFESGYDLADPVDQAIMATRKAVFPRWRTCSCRSRLSASRMPRSTGWRMSWPAAAGC